MRRRRVAVTGVGLISSLGIGVDQNLKSLSEGKSGAGPITLFNTEGFKTTFACEIKGFVAEDFLTPKDAKHMDRFIQLCVATSKMAMENSGLDQALTDELKEKTATIIGSGLGGLTSIEAGKVTQLERGPTRLSPFFIPSLISNLGPGHVAIKYGLQGPSYTTTSACSSGAHAVGEAFRLIQTGVCDAAVTGGAESTVTPLGIAGFNAMRALSQRNDEPQKASRPFDKDRDGFVVGEGAGILVLEEFEAAKKRGADILAELVGYGSNCDAYHMTAPSPNGRGAAEAMRLSLKDAGLNPADVGAINAHGTSTQLGDIAETQAIKSVFESHSKSLKVSSTKSMTGHTLGAAGGVESIFSVLALKHQMVPPTINLDEADPECDLDYVPNTAQDFKHSVGLSNSFGFGGTNVSLIFKAV